MTIADATRKFVRRRANYRGRDVTRESHLDAMAHELGVTKRNLKHRLKDVGWIYIPDGSKTIYLGKAAPNKQKRVG